MMLQQKVSFFFNARKRLHTEYPFKQRPETILWMSIEEAVFSGFDGGKGTQDQDLRIGPKNRHERVGDGLMCCHCYLSNPFRLSMNALISLVICSCLYLCIMCPQSRSIV